MLRCSFVLATLLCSVGCKHVFPVPYTVDALTTDSATWPGDALVHYLAQPNADVTVCDPRRGALQRFDEDLAEPLVTALREGSVPAETWGACGRELIGPVTPPFREFFLGRLARAVLDLLSRDDGAARLIAANEVLDARPREASPALEALLARLNEVDRTTLPPMVPPVFDSLVTTLELDHGRYAGKALTEADLESVQDDGVLWRMEARLRDEALRRAAKRRLVRLRIERSDWPEVKARADEVEGAVMSYGRWAQPVASLKLVSAPPPLALPFAGVVQQDLDAQVATLHTRGDQRLGLAPTLELRPHLQFPVGWSRPLPLCRAAKALSVEPCLDPKDLEFSSLGTVDDEGVLRLPERMPMEQVFSLARAGEGLSLVVKLNGQLVTTLSVPLDFVPPASTFFEGAESQGGPAVNVVVTSTADALVFEAVSETGARKYAVLPRVAARSGFEIGSRGGRGFTGRDGVRGDDGVSGFDGVAASCPSGGASAGGAGGDGGPGGDGGDGGPGGNGGPVNVTLQCSLECGVDSELVRVVVRSRGGSGGRGGDGGRGGSGGRGGRGGAGVRCSNVEFPSGTDGSRGNSGRDGSSGAWGRDGDDGVVTFQ